MPTTCRRIVEAALLPCLLLAVWEISVRSGWWPRTLIAAPSEVLLNLLRLGGGELLLHGFVSLYRLLSGFLLGSSMGFLLGTCVGLSRLAHRLIAPTIQFLAPVPPVAWIPLLIILFGIGDPSKVALIAVGSFFVLFVNTVSAIRATDTDLVELAQLYEKNRFELAMQVLIPSALPRVATALRVALGLSWILLIAAEVIASASGLGWLIWDSRNFSRPDDMLVGMLAIGFLGQLTDAALLRYERYVLRWHPAFTGL